MALVVADRVKETTTTTGTGTVTLAGAVTGFQSFAVVGNANTTYYAIVVEGGADWEVGIGTYTSSGTTLSRNTVLESSNSNSLVNFGVGTKAVFVTYPADRSVTSDYPNTFTNNQVISVNSSSAALRITQTGAGDALLVEDSSNPDSSPFVVNADGDVGIGTATPNTQLAVYRSGTSASISCTTDGALSNIYSQRSSNDTAGGLLTVRKSRGTSSAQVIVQADDNVGTLDYRAFDGTAYQSAARISVEVDGTPGSTDMPGRLIFSTTPDNVSTPLERMRITSSGNVGIGIVPAVALDVLGVIEAQAAAAQDAIRLQGRAGGTSSFSVTLVPTTLTASRTLTLPDASTTVVGTDATQTLTNKTLTNPTVTNYVETRFTANSSTAITLDLANGTMQDITLTANATITMPTAVAGKSFILLLRSGAGGFAVTWTTVKWASGNIPVVTSTAGRLDIYSFFSDGTNWYGVTVNQNFTP